MPASLIDCIVVCLPPVTMVATVVYLARRGFFGPNQR